MTLSRLSIVTILLGMALAPVGAASAQTHSVVLDTTLVLPDVVVTATRSATHVEAAPMRVTVLDSAAVAETASKSVADVLERRSAAFIRRYGGGGLATVSLRGTSAAQTLVLLDGHRIADPQLGQLDLSLLPALLVNTVEIAHGAASPLYGTDGMGGVVNLRTGASERGSAAVVTAGVGAFGERSGGVRLSSKHGSLSGVLLASFEGSENDYAYLNRALYPPRSVTRHGADRQWLSLYGTARYHQRDSDVRLAGWYNNAERGLPSVAGTRSSTERQWDEQLRLWGDYDRRLSRGRLKMGALFQDAVLRYVDHASGIDQSGHTQLASADIQMETYAMDAWLLATGLSGGFGRAKHPALASDASQVHGGGFFHGTGEYGPLVLYAAFRLDGYRLPASSLSAVSPRVGINLKTSRRLRIKASAGRSFRVPTFNDRYWQPGGRPDLRPEHGWTYDTGASFAGEAFRAELTLFSSHLHDQIVWSPTGSGVWRPDNIRRVWSRGLEADMQLHPNDAFRGGVFYTFTAARDRSEPSASSYGQQVRYVPAQQAKLFAALSRGAASLDLNARYIGRRYVTVDGSQSLDPYVVLDAKAQVRMRTQSAELRLALVVENLGDVEYRVVQGHPMPPRHARLQATLVLE